jgi:hypothetical protein
MVTFKKKISFVNQVNAASPLNLATQADDVIAY